MSEKVVDRMDEDDWIDVMESELVDYTEGIHSVGFVFEHDEIGLHGFKFDKKEATLEPVAFSKTGEDEE